MQKIILFILTLLILPYAYCSSVFKDTFYISTTGHNEIKILSAIAKEGDPLIKVGEIYNPAYLSEYLKYPYFVIQKTEVVEQKNSFRNVEVKIGYDDNNYCLLTVNDGTQTYASAIATQCVGNIGYYYYDGREAVSNPTKFFFGTGINGMVQINHNYYLYFKDVAR